MKKFAIAAASVFMLAGVAACGESAADKAAEKQADAIEATGEARADQLESQAAPAPTAASAAAANGIAGLAFVNTIFATGAAVLTWIGIEAIIKGKASLLGAASGAVAGLVAVTPAAGFIGPMGSILIGVAGGAAGLFGVTALKRALGADDSFDVFGVHGVAGIVGAILTGVLADASFGGVGLAEGATIASQAVVQIKGVLITIVWSAIAAFISYKIAGLLSGGLRVTPEEEQQGLDLVSHGEKAYN